MRLLPAYIDKTVKIIVWSINNSKQHTVHARIKDKLLVISNSFLYSCLVTERNISILGYYAFIEASSPRSQGEKAWLYSPAFNGTASSSSCLIFWYHMYGASIGKLNIYQQNLNPTSSKTLIWTLSGNKGNKWNSGQVSVGKAKQYKV